MRTLRRSPYLRPASWSTLLAVLAMVVGPVAPALAVSTEPAAVAVVQVTNQSGSSVQNLAARLAAALNAQLAGSGQYKVLGQAQVDQAVTAAGVRLPLRRDLRAQQLAAIAAALKCDYLLIASIDSVEVDPGKQMAAVTTQLECYGRLAKGDLAQVPSTAFNLDRSNNEAVLLDDALEQSALHAVKQLTTNLQTVGRVLTPQDEDTVSASFRNAAAFHEGAQFVVKRNGERIALATLRAAQEGATELRITQRDRPELTAAVNDEVQLYRDGTGRAVSGELDLDPNRQAPNAAERGHRSVSTVWAVVGGLALLGLGVWAFTQGGDSRDENRTPGLVSPPNASILTIDAQNELVSPVSFVATSVRSADTLTLQIASDANFTTLAYTETKTGTSTGGTGTTTGTTQEPLSSVSFAAPTATAFLAPGGYFWRVVSVSANQTYTSNTFTFTIVRQGGNGTFLRSPDVVNALPGSGTVELQWSPVSAATGYEVWRRILTPRYANAVSGRTFQPATGSNLWTRDNARRSPRLDRGNRRPGYTGSAVSRQGNDASLAGFTRVAEATSNQLSYTDNSVSNGTEYQWVVLSKDAGGTVTPLGDAQAGSFVATTPLSTAPPTTPANLTAVAGDGQVVLTWTDSTASDLAGYQVFRATSANGNFVDVTNNLVLDSQSPAGQALSAGPNDISVTDRNLTNGVQLYYRIRAVQLTTLVNGTTRGGLESALSDAVPATPSSAPPQELQVVQPPNNSTIDADRPQLAWRGVTGAAEYTIQISTSQSFPSAGLIQTTSTESELIYPSGLPALVVGSQYFMRIGVFDTTQQALRFGPVSTFNRGAVQRFTTTVSATVGGVAANGARVTIDAADSGEVTPAQFILGAKAGGAAYSLSAVLNNIDGTRFSGTVSYRPGVDSANVVIPLANVGTAPPAPTGLSGTGQTDRIVLRWNPDANLGTAGVTAATYSVRRRSNTEEGTFTEVARVDAPTVTGPGAAPQLFYTDFNVRQGVRYFYQIVGITAGGIESVPSVTTNAVAGVGNIQVITPQDNQTFEAAITPDSWSSPIDFAWLAVPGAARYIFEIGLDVNLHRLLANGNQIIASGASPSTTVTLSETAPAGFDFIDDGDIGIQTLYWRVVAVDENNVILNQTEARRIFQNAPGIVAEAP
ncbi:MAG: hypothetical protein IT204_07970 [Fimbriimonadaceae bacterium]|nr:hypothetical protein [Fimbriimonadaceae bacterium]